MAPSAKIEALRARVASDPYDAQGWDQLLGELSRGRKSDEKTAQLRQTYEELLAKFPTAAAYWREYCELEIEAGDPETVKTLFSRCLLTCLDVDLWRTYLRFIRRFNEARGAEGAGEVRQSFEFALDHVGQDLRSGSIWQDYVAFLAGPKPGSAEHVALFGAAPEGQEDSQRTAALRRAYHRALGVPTAALDALWQGYERFENGTGNKTLAKREIDDWRPRFQAARGLVKERTARVEAVDARALAVPPGRGGPRRAAAAAAWRELLRWERANPQELDPAAYHARVGLAYEQALSVLLLHPELWLDFAEWHAAGGGAGAAAAKEVLHRGRATLPGALALQFAAAEAEEAAGALDAARAVFEDLVWPLTAEPAAPKEEGKGKEGGDAAPAPAADAPAAVDTEAKPEAGADGDQGGGAKPEGADDKGAGPGAEKAAEKAPLPTLSPQAGTLAWIQYMRFARRSSGMMAARKLFLRARKWPALRWEAFAASAAMEWAAEAKEQIPRNIYELGLKSFLSEPQYVLRYAAFLQGLGDTGNARGLLERALTATPTAAAAPLYDAYLRLEAAAGSLAAVAGLEQRRREALGADALAAGLDAAHLAAVKYDALGLSAGAVAPEAAPGRAPAPLPAPAAAEGEDRRRSTRRRRSRSRSRSPPAPRAGGDRDRDRDRRPPADPSEPIRHFPRELAQLLNQLPLVPDGPVPDIEKVIDVILRMDFSPEGIEVHEDAAAKERRRQRASAGGPPRGAPGGGLKRKADERGAPMGGAYDSDSDASSDDGEEGDGGADVYRRRMRARV